MTPPPPPFSNSELQRKNLNVAAGGVFYEKAQSRRERHRAALAETAVEAVALGRRRRPAAPRPFVDMKETEEQLKLRGKLRAAKVV